MLDPAIHTTSRAARPRAHWLLAAGLILFTFVLALPAVAAASAAPEITVDTPAAGAVWAGSDTQTVAWTLSSAVDEGEFCVCLPIPGSEGWYFVEWIAPVSDRTSYSIGVPVTGVPPGDGYQVYVGWSPTVGTADWAVIATSGSFTMQSAGPLPAIRSLSPKRGMVGTQVTITGSSFGASRGSKYVAFGSTKAKIKSWSATRIRAVVPAGAVAGRCTVKVRDAGRASKGVTFTVTAPPGGDDGLVGTWHENSMAGWAQMYRFRAAGTFVYAITDASGLSTTTGSYLARGRSIRLFNQIVDGKRATGTTLSYSYRDDGMTLYIDSLWFFHKR